MSLGNSTPGCGLTGDNFYTKYNIIHKDVLQTAQAYILHILEEIAFSGDTFVIADYGAADGSSSMEMFTKGIGIVKKRFGTNQQIQVYYEDQPANNFKALFEKIHGTLEGQTSYYLQYSDVFVSAVGTSFYSQCLPTNTVHFGFSNTAFHWLSKRPCSLKRALYFYDQDTDDDEKRLFCQQAARDWSTILLHRAQELSPGGQLVTLCLGIDPQGRVSGGRNSQRVINALWRGLWNDGIITEEELQGTNLDVYSRSEEEIAAPFEDKESAVYKSGLRLVSVKWTLTEDPYNVRWISAKAKDEYLDPREHARSYVKGQRAWNSSSINAGLAETRTEAEKQNVLDTFYQRLEDVVAADPGNHGTELVHAIVHLQKHRDFDA